MNWLSCLVVGGLGVLAGMSIQKDQYDHSEMLKERFAKNRENDVPYKVEPPTPKVPKFQDPPRGYNLFQDPPVEPKQLFPNLPLGNIPQCQQANPNPKVFSTPEPEKGSEEDLKKIMEEIVKECGGDANKLDQAAHKLGYAFTWLTRLRGLNINGIQKAVSEINNEQAGKLNDLIARTEAAGRGGSFTGQSESKTEIVAGEIDGSINAKEDKDGDDKYKYTLSRSEGIGKKNAGPDDFAHRDHSRMSITDVDGKVIKDSGATEKKDEK